MKKIISKIIAFATFIALIAPAAHAQFNPYNLTYNWAKVTATGPTGTVGVDQYLNFTFNPVLSSGPYYTFDWTVTGTPGACTFQIEGSSDGVTWYSLASAVGSPLSCTTSNITSVVGKPVRNLRVNVLTFTGSGATVIFHFTGSK